MKATHGQPGSCRARQVNEDDGLEDRWIRVLGGEKLPAASYALLPKPEKKACFLPSERDRDFCRLFSKRQRPNVFVSDAWPAPATYHGSFCEHCDQRVGRSPQISCRSRWFCRSMSVQDSSLAASNKHLAEFFSGRSWPKIGPGISFFGVFEKFETFFEDLRS